MVNAILDAGKRAEPAKEGANGHCRVKDRKVDDWYETPSAGGLKKEKKKMDPVLIDDRWTSKSYESSLSRVKVENIPFVGSFSSVYPAFATRLR